MQARWALAHWRGRVALPSQADMEADTKKRRKGRTYPQYQHYVQYMDSLAADIGVAPPLSWEFLLRNPQLACKLFFGPVVPAQYRLTGQHPWEQAPEFLRAQPLSVLR